MSERDPNRILSCAEAAKYLNLKPQTLRRWRWAGQGPAYVRLGVTQRSKVGYRVTDLDLWVAKRTFAHTSDESARA